VSKRFKKWLKRIALGGVLFVLAAWIIGAALIRGWEADPPPMPADTSVLKLKSETRDGRVWFGQSWSGQREGLPVVRLKGSPFEMGYADGRLMQDRMHTLEDEFFKMIEGYVPQHWLMESLKYYIIYRNRHLSDFVPLSYRTEIFGTSLGCSDIHPEEGPFYNRLLNYHAAHDVSYMMIDNPFIARAGCTAFGAWGKQTSNGHLITGRNFDWEAAEVFSRDRVVMMVEPDQGIPFISLSWAGMAGVVSGMNRAGVSVTVNGAPSQLPDQTATPVAIVAREIMERAHNLNEALEILRNAKVFVSTLWFIGSRADGKFLVVEKTPTATQVREPEGESIVCGNHFQTPGLKDEPRNTNYIAEATSVSREERLKELLGQSSGKLDVAGAVQILRDRDLPGGTFAGNGHRSALNALIATHAVVMDLTDGIIWAASPPNQIGKFVAFDVNDFDRELPALTIPADPMLASGEFEKERKSRQCLADGYRALKRNDASTALAQAEQAEALNPGFYQNAALQGRALLALGRKDEAAKAFNTAIAQRPAFSGEKRQLEELLRQAQQSAH
jgi:hypothetical protein